MFFSKKEVDTHYPLSERIRIEKAKTQNSLPFWINELISTAIPAAEDVPSLLKITKDLLAQVEDLYAEKERLLAAFPGATSVEDVIQLSQGMEEQLKSLYKEKEKQG